MAIEELIKFVPPPTARQWSPLESDWLKICAQLGTNLPRDYRELIVTFGAGSFGDFIWVRDPFTTNEYLNLLVEVPRQLAALRSLRDDFGEPIPYSLFPSAGGLLPCAATDNGDVVYWITRGSPDAWSVAVNESRGPNWKSFDMRLSEFLFQVLNGKLKCEIFPDDFPPPRVDFRPWTPG